MLDACTEIGAAFVAFAPLGRGFLTDVDVHPESFVEKDIRRAMPRFREPSFEANAHLLTAYRALAGEAGCSPAQLALAWLLQKASHILPIPGTTSVEHLEANVAAATITLEPQIVERLEALVNQQTISGRRYAEATLAEIDSEEFE